MAALALFGVAWHNKTIPLPTPGDMTRRGLGSLKRAKAVSLFLSLSHLVSSEPLRRSQQLLAPLRILRALPIERANPK